METEPPEIPLIAQNQAPVGESDLNDHMPNCTASKTLATNFFC